MLPELTAIYVIGTIPPGFMMGFQLWRENKKRTSSKYITLQKNLKKINLFWSDVRSEVVAYAENAENSESQTIKSTILLFGTGSLILSWLGFAFQLLIYISTNQIAVPRLERKLFSSLLASQILEPDQIKGLLTEIAPENIKSLIHSRNSP